MWFSRTLLRIFGWKIRIFIPDYPKLIICVAPHTSNWDFIIGKLAYASIGRKTGFLMKESWFFWPLGPIFKALGGIPVPRRRGSSLTDVIVEKFRTEPQMTLAITPEGTRSRVDKWRHGFLYIAMQADVPIALAAIDYPTKTGVIDTIFEPTGDVEADMRTIKNYYRQFTGKYPEKFCAD